MFLQKILFCINLNFYIQLKLTLGLSNIQYIIDTYIPLFTLFMPYSQLTLYLAYLILCYILLSLHFTKLTLYLVYLVLFANLTLSLPYTQLTLHLAYLILRLPYTQLTLYFAYILLYLHFTKLTLYLAYLILFANLILGSPYHILTFYQAFTYFIHI